MATRETPRGEELMQVYGALLDLVTVKEREWLDQLMERAAIHGNFTMEGATAALPTLTGDVERLLPLASHYGVSFKS